MRLGLPSLAVALVLLLTTPAAAQDRIVGGQVTTKDWPHMAALEFKDDGEDEFSFICGASLVAQDVVLTAAHCVDAGSGEGGDPDTYPAESFRLLLGTKKRSQGGERIGAVQVLEHPEYDDDPNGGHDVALIKLASPSTLGSRIRIADEQDAPQWEPGDDSTVIGWGSDAFLIGDVSDDLKEVTIPIVSDEKCEMSYALTLGFDGETMVCAGNDEGGEDSCQGDSGGPLMVQDASGTWIQVGAVSYGLGCGYPTQYGVYAEVGSDPLRGWVIQNATAMSSSGGPLLRPAEPQPSSTSGAAPAPATTQQSQQQPAQPATTTRSGAARPAQAAAARLTIARRLGSARAARRLGRVLVRVVSTRRLHGLRIVVRQRGRTVALGRRATLARAGRLRLGIRRGLRRGAAVLTLTARDDLGRRVRVVRRVTLRR